MASYLPSLFIVVAVIQYYSSICAAQECTDSDEETATTSPQSLQSPGYDTGSYHANLFCVTHIRSSDPHRVIQLEFEEFDLEDSADCTKDVLVVYDGIDGGQRLMQHSCGSQWAWPHYPDIVRSSGPEVTLNFITDGTNDRRHRGYRLKYKTVAPNPSVLYIAAPDEKRIHGIRRHSAVNFAIYPHGLEYPQAVDYDPVDNWLYYTDKETQSIGRYDTLLQTTEILHTKEITDPFGLRVDIVNGLLYWTDASEQTVSVSNLDGTQRMTLVAPRGSRDDLHKPGAIVIEPNQGYIYYTDWGTPAKIEKATGCGTERLVIVQDSISSPQGLAIDLSGNDHRLYWVDTLLDTLNTVDVNGGNRRTLARLNERDFFSIALDDGSFFMTDEEFGWIELVDRQSTLNRIRVYIGSIREPRGITLRPAYVDEGDIRSYTCPRSGRADCDGLCLPKPRNGHVCQTVLPQILVGCPGDVQLVHPMNSTTWREPFAISFLGGSQPLTTTRTHSPGQEFPLGINVVSYTFEDYLGNQASCNFTVTVTEQFGLACPGDIEVEALRGETEAVATWTPPVDHQGDPVTTFNYHPGDSFPLGDTIVEYSTIVGTIVEKCNFTVTVKGADLTGPRFINCPNDILRIVRQGVTSVMVSWPQVKLDDPADRIVLKPGDAIYERQHDHQQMLGTHEYYLGDETVTYKATDPNKNVEWCNFTVSVRVDDQKPTLLGCPTGLVEYVQTEDEKAIVDWKEPVAVDNPGNVSLEVNTDTPPGSKFGVGQHVVVYTATDPRGLDGICAFLVTVAIEVESGEPNSAAVVNNGPLDEDALRYVYIFGAVILLLLIIIVLLLVVIAYRCNRKRARTPGLIYDHNDRPSPPDYHYAVGGAPGVDEPSRGSGAVAISGGNVRYQAETNRALDIAEDHPYDLAAVALPPRYEEEEKKMPFDADGEKSVPPGFNSWNE